MPRKRLSARPCNSDIKKLLTFERTSDLALIKLVMTHPRVYPHITDDGSAPVEEFHVLEHPAIWYVLVKDDDELLGLFMFVSQNAVCAEVHTCLLPNALGARAKEAARGVVAWMFEQTTLQRIVTNVPANNRLALHYAKRGGMTEYGLNPKSFLKGGILQDQILLGLSR